MICPKLITRVANQGQLRRELPSVSFDRYYFLHLQGKGLIRGWFIRAWDMREDFDLVNAQNIFSPNVTALAERRQFSGQAMDYCFEAFSFVWYAFNAWATCVTGVDSDRAYITILSQNDTICRDFARLVAHRDSPLAIYAARFAKFWPIFDSKSLRELGIIRTLRGEREKIVEYYLKRGAHRFEPSCWKRHKDAGEPIPIDWQHTLLALYKVRCNLFHGEKALDSENDQLVVHSAFHTLLYFLHSANYFGLNGMP